MESRDARACVFWGSNPATLRRQLAPRLRLPGSLDWARDGRDEGILEKTEVCRSRRMVALNLLRGGVVPIMCGSASCCFALYAAKVYNAAAQWRWLKPPASFDHERCKLHAQELDRHAAGCVALAVTSGAAAFEAAIDHRRYRSASPVELGTFFATRAPFFLRPTVLVTAAASLGASLALVGRPTFIAPPRPTLRPSGGNKRANDDDEAPATGSAPSASRLAECSSERSNGRAEEVGTLVDDAKLRCATWAKMLAACERSTTPKTRFHCDPQLKRWRQACEVPSAELDDDQV